MRKIAILFMIAVFSVTTALHASGFPKESKTELVSTIKVAFTQNHIVPTFDFVSVNRIATVVANDVAGYRTTTITPSFFAAKLYERQNYTRLPDRYYTLFYHFNKSTMESTEEAVKGIEHERLVDEIAEKKLLESGEDCVVVTEEDVARTKLIHDLKAKHGDVVHEVNVGGYTCYLKEPDRKTLSFASAVGAKDSLKFNEVILNNCWLAGDEIIKTKNGLFLGVSAKIGELIDIQEATIKKV